MNKSVVVGLSGGVDSSVAAYLLKEKGYKVYGVTMIQFDNPGFLSDAKKVADFLNIEFGTVDMREKFRKEICEYFANEYLKGRTPNPCSKCNPLIKWDALLDYAKKVGADFVATGHYARIDLMNGRYSVKNSVTAAKDQTYALAGLFQQQLSKTLMPLGDYTKEEVRRIAESINLPVAEKKDSQDICFIDDNDYSGFLQSFTNKLPQKGNFVTEDGRVLGIHKGISHYTIGQRKGLNLSMGHPVFVTQIRPDINEVVIGESEDLFKKAFICKEMNFMSGTSDLLPLRLKCKVRYAHKGSECVLSQIGEDEYLVEFDEAVRAITPGQSAVFYLDDYVFGGAFIERTI